MLPVARGPHSRAVGHGMATGVGRPGRSRPPLRGARRVRAPGRDLRGRAGSAERMASVLDGEGLLANLLLDDGPERVDAELRRPGVHIVVAPLDLGAVISGAKLAIVAEPDVTGRRRPHRQARPGPAGHDGFFDDLAPGNFVVHHGTASPASAAWSPGPWAGRPRLPAPRVPGRRQALPPLGPDRGPHPLHRRRVPDAQPMGGSEWHARKHKVRAAVHEIAEELVELYRRRLHGRGHAFGPDTPWQAEMESSFPSSRRPTSCRRSRTSRRTWSSPADGPPGLRRRRLRQDRGRRARRVQGGAGRLPGRRAGPDDTARQPARPDLRRPVSPPTRSGSSCSVAFSHRAQAARSSRGWPTARSTW